MTLVLPDLPLVVAYRSASSAGWSSPRRRARLYLDLDLDLVAVAPDGALAGCCMARFDGATGVAEIEPLGSCPSTDATGWPSRLPRASRCRGDVPGCSQRREERGEQW